MRTAAAIALTTVALAALGLASSAAADITIGANVNQSTTESGTCGFGSPSQRPCMFVTSVIPGQTMTAPCDGTVTRFRLNGFPKPNNRYRLRVVRKNADGSFTGTATSAEVAIASEGVNEYATNLPIAAGEEIGLDFQGSAEEHGVRWVGGSGVGASYLYAFPADGGSAFQTGPATFYYLFNADVACTPSNEFHVVKVKGSKLTVQVASAGAVVVTNAAAKKKLLKRSRSAGGPGRVKVDLKLTGAAKQALRKKGKVKVRARITFTPTGGSASTQVRKLTVISPGGTAH